MGMFQSGPEIWMLRSRQLPTRTAWYAPGTHPVRRGYYERNYVDGIYLHYWDGKVWRSSKDSRHPHWRQVNDYPMWRGLVSRVPSTNAHRK